MGEGKTNMFGKTYNTIGSTDSNFIIRTKGDLKVQWGGKFIDVIKNGKLASAGADILKVASSSDDISSNGVYLVPTDGGNEVWVSIDGTKVNISGEVGTTYVSFLTEQKEVTADQRYTALVNAGLYYETLEDAQEAGVKAGLIFIVNEGKLYIVKDGILSEYTPTSSSQYGNDTENAFFDEITVGELKIYKEGTTMSIDSTDLQLYVNQQLCASISNVIKPYFSISMQDGTYIQSEGATQDTGFRIYKKGVESVLEIDSIVWRNKDKDLGIQVSTMDTAVIYSTHSNIISSAEQSENGVICTLGHQNQFSVGQKVYVFLGLNPHISISYQEEENFVIVTAQLDNDLLASQDIQIEINYTVGGVLKNGTIVILTNNNSGDLVISSPEEFGLVDYRKVSGPEDVIIGDTVSKNSFVEFDVVEKNDQTITLNLGTFSPSLFIAKCKNQQICTSNVPLIKIEQNNVDVLDRSKTVINNSDSESETQEVSEKPDDTIHTRIGVINEQEFEGLKKCPEKQEEVQVGIYSDNFIGLNSKLYDSVFKKRCDYPKYDESVEIPEDFQDEKYNKAVPSVEWIKELIKLAVPSGTIAMYNGQSEIPEGWAVCDGNNGTPNLVGKFIKAVSAIDQIGDNESELNENNELIITQEHLPKHSHPHKPHTHNLEGNLSGTTGSSGDLTVSLNYSDYNWGIGSVQKTFVTSVTGEGVTSETGTVDGVSNIRTQGGKATGGSHTHSISLDVEEGVSLSSATSKEETLEDSEWPNKPLKIEPRSYSLVFIMKL